MVARSMTRSCSTNCSARFCSVMSWQIADAPTTEPFASQIGETVSEAGNTVPSLRTRTVSRCSMCWPAPTLARIVFISSVRSSGFRSLPESPIISWLE